MTTSDDEEGHVSLKPMPNNIHSALQHNGPHSPHLPHGLGLHQQEGHHGRHLNNGHLPSAVHEGRRDSPPLAPVQSEDEDEISEEEISSTVNRAGSPELGCRLKLKMVKVSKDIVTDESKGTVDGSKMKIDTASLGGEKDDGNLSEIIDDA